MHIDVCIVVAHYCVLHDVSFGLYVSNATAEFMLAFFFLSFHNLLLVCKCTSDAVPNVAIAVAAVAAAYPFFFCLCSDRARAPQLSADTQY